MVKKPGSNRKSASASAKPDKSSRPKAIPQPAATPTILQDARDQQRVLNLFADAFGPVLTSDSFNTTLQEIKQALFNRDFAAAFEREDYLGAYAARWSPTRALSYATVFLGIRECLSDILLPSRQTDQASASSAIEPAGECSMEEQQPAEANPATETTLSFDGRLTMVSIGGCAAEHLAFTSYIREMNIQGDLTLLDSAPWSSITTLLQDKITSMPPLSKYASAAAKAANRPLLSPDQLSCNFIQQNVLDLEQEELGRIMGVEPLVVTLLFTLNELYTNGGISKTTKLLKNLGQVLPHGSLILVVDSPGSYSEAAVGKEKKKYPMQWLLDHTLTGVESPNCRWERVIFNQSAWFRLPEGLSYPISLENMRYQIHLYRIQKQDSISQ